MIVAYQVDGCAFTLREGLPIPTHEDARRRGSRSSPPRPARPRSKVSSPRRYAHEPGETENVATALFGEAPGRRAGRRQPRRDGDVHPSRRLYVFNAGVIDSSFGLKHADPHVQLITKNVLDRLPDDPPVARP